MPEGLLHGLRALDLTDEKGALCGKILADLGVDTIKVEKTGGDALRNTPPFYRDQADPQRSLLWFACHNNKRGITLNLETGTGQDLFRRLVAKADFVIESFPPGHMKTLGLAYDDLAKIRPQIIMTSITPFGQDGPYARFKASDIAVQSLAAPLYGDPDRAPVRISVAQAYLHAGADAAEGTMMAHYHRVLTGEGQHVDVSAMESTICVEATERLANWNATRANQKRVGNMAVSAGLSSPRVWACKDSFVMYAIAGGLLGARRNRLLTEWMDSEHVAPLWMKEKDWDSWDWLKTTQAEIDLLVGAISHFFKQHTGDELQTGATKKGVMLHKVCDARDTFNNAQLKARDFWNEITHEELGVTITYPGPFARFSETPISRGRRAPLIGEHNAAVYGTELGISERELEALETRGVI